MRALFSLLAAAVMMALAVSLRRPASVSAASPSPVLQGSAVAGRKVYEARCAVCHGEDAKGSAGFAKKVGAYSPDALDLTSDKVQGLDDRRLAFSIEHGHGKMPDFGARLSEREVGDVIAYLRSIGHAHARGGAVPKAKSGR